MYLWHHSWVFRWLLVFFVVTFVTSLVGWIRSRRPTRRPLDREYQNVRVIFREAHQQMKETAERQGGQRRGRWSDW